MGFIQLLLEFILFCGVLTLIITCITMIVLPYKYWRIIGFYRDIRQFLTDPSIHMPRPAFQLGQSCLQLVHTMQANMGWEWFCNPFMFYRREIVMDKTLHVLREYHGQMYIYLFYDEQLRRGLPKKMKAYIEDFLQIEVQKDVGVNSHHLKSEERKRSARE